MSAIVKSRGGIRGRKQKEPQPKQKEETQQGAEAFAEGVASKIQHITPTQLAVLFNSENPQKFAKIIAEQDVIEKREEPEMDRVAILEREIQQLKEKKEPQSAKLGLMFSWRSR